MRKAHDEKPWVRERMRQEIRSSPQYQALPQLAAMLFQKIREHKKSQSKLIVVTESRAKKFYSPREEILQLVRSSDSLARRSLQPARRN